VDSPLYEIALVAFVNWCMGRKDWAAFTEIFGLPNGVAIMPANIPPGMEDEYRAAAERVADGVSGALPNGSDIKFPTASVRGEAPFKNFCDAQDGDVVLAGTGGRLAMLSADKGGLGNGPALEHAAAFDEIAQADARRINAALQNDFDRQELAMEFPGQPALAYFELCAQDATDAAQVVTNVAALAAAGFAVDAAWLSEVTGIKFAGSPSSSSSPIENNSRTSGRTNKNGAPHKGERV
jgi:phage gp29-like protein